MLIGHRERVFARHPCLQVSTKTRDLDTLHLTFIQDDRCGHACAQCDLLRVEPREPSPRELRVGWDGSVNVRHNRSRYRCRELTRQPQALGIGVSQDGRVRLCSLHERIFLGADNACSCEGANCRDQVDQGLGGLRRDASRPVVLHRQCARQLLNELRLIYGDVAELDHVHAGDTERLHNLFRSTRGIGHLDHDVELADLRGRALDHTARQHGQARGQRTRDDGERVRCDPARSKQRERVRHRKGRRWHVRSGEYQAHILTSN